jgi:hypothetical protein
MVLWFLVFMGKTKDDIWSKFGQSYK